jgi:hypothetical protein
VFENLIAFVDVLLLDALLFDPYAEDILSSFERWQQKEPLPDSAPKKVRILAIVC